MSENRNLFLHQWPQIEYQLDECRNLKTANLILKTQMKPAKSNSFEALNKLFHLPIGLRFDVFKGNKLQKKPENQVRKSYFIIPV